LNPTNIKDDTVLSTKDELLKYIKHFVNEVEDDTDIKKTDVLKNMLKEIL
jgi:hypothetical protein